MSDSTNALVSREVLTLQDIGQLAEQRWIQRMKCTIRTLGWRFNADRMVMDYTLKCHVPAAGCTSSDIAK